LLDAGIDAIDLFTEKSGFLPSKSEARRAIQGKGLSINKQVVNAVEQKIDATYLINEKYILLQKGKKDYFLVIAEN
jgi:tyrosyl-tRNA synthetase